MKRRQSYIASLEQNLEKLNSLRVGERDDAQTFFSSALESNGSYRTEAVDFLLNKYNYSSVKVQMNLLPLFLEYGIKEALPIFIDVLKNGIENENRELQSRIIDIVLGLSDGNAYRKLAHLLIRGPEDINRMIMRRVKNLDDRNWYLLCWSISRLEKKNDCTF